MTAPHPNLVFRFSLAWRLRATFADNRPPRRYLSPDIRRRDPGWGGEAFNRRLAKLELFLPTGHRILLAGMREYNFFLEAVQDLSGRWVDIQAFYLCGRYPNRPAVAIWRIAQGRVSHHIKPPGREYHGTATRGWKAGAPARPVSMLTGG